MVRIVSYVSSAQQHLRRDYRSFAERQLLCIINRWFKPGDARSIPTVFRAMTGSESSNNAIRSQWDGHMYVRSQFHMFINAKYHVK